MKRFASTLAAVAAAVALLTLTACGGSEPAGPTPTDVPAVQTFLHEQYADKTWVRNVNGATVSDGTLTIRTNYPGPVDTDNQAAAQEICAAGKSFAKTQDGDTYSGAVTVEAANTLMLARC